MLGRREEEKQRRLEEAAAYQAPEWATGQPVVISESSSDDEAAAAADPLYCVACDRTFKSQGAMQSHERYIACLVSLFAAVNSCTSTAHA